MQIRDLYAARPRPNLANYMFFSNKRDSVLINTNDRRYNVGRYQSQKLEDKHKEFASDQQTVDALIEKELQNFAWFLRSYPLDEDAARRPLKTDDRATMMETTTPAADKIGEALNEDKALMATLIEALPVNDKRINAAQREAAKDFRQVLVDNMLRTIERTSHPKRAAAMETNGVMSRDEAFTIFDYCVGGMKHSPTKFTQYLHHRHLKPTKVWVDGKSITGLRMNWVDADRFPEYLKQLGYKQTA